MGVKSEARAKRIAFRLARINANAFIPISVRENFFVKIFSRRANAGIAFRLASPVEKIPFVFFLHLVCRERQTERFVCTHFMMRAKGNKITFVIFISANDLFPSEKISSLKFLLVWHEHLPPFL